MRKKLTASPAPFLFIHELLDVHLRVFNSAIPSSSRFFLVRCKLLFYATSCYLGPGLPRLLLSHHFLTFLFAFFSFLATHVHVLSIFVRLFFLSSHLLSPIPSCPFVLFLPSTLPGVFPSLPIHILRDPVSSSLPHLSSLSLPSRANDFSHQSSFAVNVICSRFSPAPHPPSPLPPSFPPSPRLRIGPYQATPSSLLTAAHLLSPHASILRSSSSALASRNPTF
ncbi:hypothetical protein C8J57DRAFT_1503983 [Mycena rebaudengoi]|nr:hypothetical protein C8J57DRAFT_1503983 [Mycena rebaudengoi]